MDSSTAQIWPQIRTVGVTGFLISFADTLSEAANRAALAFREAIEREGWQGVDETSSTLVSAFVRFDPLAIDHTQLRDQLSQLVQSQDWFEATLPQGRRRWQIPTVFGTDVAPQLAAAAAQAELSEDQAISSICDTVLRVQTIGFAPGQPYLGTLSECWDIPRQSELTKQVPAGALTVAIRQLVLFAVPAPTGWQHIGQTAMRLFQPDTENPFLLRPGDEVQFTSVDYAALENMYSDPMGGAKFEEVR